MVPRREVIAAGTITTLFRYVYDDKNQRPNTNNPARDAYKRQI